MQANVSDLTTIAESAAKDLTYAAEVSNSQGVVQLIVTQPAVQERLNDPVFFSVLLCGQRWLVDSPSHQELLRDESERIVVASGRGWGKSLVTSLKAVSQFLFKIPNVDVLITSSSQRQSMQIFDYLDSHIMGSRVLRKLVQKKTRTVIKLLPPFSGKIEALPCSPNKLRGKHPDVLIVDEASVIPTQMLSSEILMMLTKSHSKLIMLGTPFGFEHPFRKAFMNPSFKVYHFPSYSSPLVSQQILQEWRQMMTQEEWQREVEALWVEIVNAYFKQDLIRECFFDPELQLEQDIENLSEKSKTIGQKHPCYAGLDLGKEQDFSVLTILYEDNGVIKLLFLKQFPLGTDYSSVIAHVAKASQIFNIRRICVDKGGAGEPVIEELRRNGINTEGLFFTEAIKEELLSNLKLKMEQSKGALAQYQPLVAQMSEQQYEYRNPKTAHERVHLHFYHPPNHHDDRLWSLALACWGAKYGQATFSIAGVPKVFWLCAHHTSFFIPTTVATRLYHLRFVKRHTLAAWLALLCMHITPAIYRLTYMSF